MTENKRFKMKKLEYESYFIDSQQEYVDEDEPNFKIDGEKTLSDSQILDLLNENEQLKKDCSNLIDDNTEYVAEINQMHKQNGQLKKELESFKPIIFESDGKPVTLYKKGDEND